MLRRCIFTATTLVVLLSLLACAGPSQQELATTVPSSTIELANLTLPELIELQEVVGEVLAHAQTIANEDRKELINQAEIVLGVVRQDSKPQNLVAEKNEQEQLILDFLIGVFSVGAQYFYEIPSQVAGAMGKGAQELGNRIAEWQVLGQLSFARIFHHDSGFFSSMNILYHKELGEIWLDFTTRTGRICVYIPIEPAIVEVEGTGNIVLSKGIKPALEQCRIAYRFIEIPSPERELPPTASAPTTIKVVGRTGEVIPDAFVACYPQESNFTTYAEWTDETGIAELALPDNIYTVVISGKEFIAVRHDIRAPTSMTVDPAGTIPVDIRVASKSGEPLVAAIWFIPDGLAPNHINMGHIWEDTEQGHLTAYVTPGTYSVYAQDYERLYFLFKDKVTIDSPVEVALSAKELDTGELQVQLDDFDEFSLGIARHDFDQPDLMFTGFNVKNEDTLVLSADLYRLGGGFGKDKWSYSIEVPWKIIFLEADGVQSIRAGGLFSGTVRVDYKGKQAGLKIFNWELFRKHVFELECKFRDAFGNPIDRSFGPGHNETFSITITDPLGKVVYQYDYWLVPPYNYFTPLENTAKGQYVVTASLDTGPHQGLVTATTTFTVADNP